MAHSCSVFLASKKAAIKIVFILSSYMLLIFHYPRHIKKKIESECFFFFIRMVRIVEALSHIKGANRAHNNECPK